jgi:hypothetical protein
MAIDEIITLWGSVYTIYNFYNYYSTKYCLKNNIQNKFSITENEEIENEVIENEEIKNNHILDSTLNCIFYKLDSIDGYCMKRKIKKIHGKFIGNITYYYKYLWINTENDLSLLKLDIGNSLRTVCIKLPLKVEYTSSDKYYQLTDGYRYYLGTDKEEMIDTIAWKQITPNAIPIAFTTVCLILCYVIKKLIK